MTAVEITEALGCNERPVRETPDRLVSQIYMAGKSKGGSKDLIELAGIVGRVSCARGASFEASYLPREWRGTLDGGVMEERIKGRINERPVERARVRLPRAADKQHNVWDAAGVGLHAVGRLAPRKVFPR
ncbi:hypothetical protein POL68_30015 [Stigmatella sp. ncwal1]|uniref:Transposase n=1 Tax=Stigmatella ashevillensis TaxID=2995309 RepID=A0ABT5DGE6_9BACT|nr:hypothetical protein [Stigmatella ashevillena]MDC0712736.1 hypothetical protein [Stigmatella ashevillena]